MADPSQADILLWHGNAHFGVQLAGFKALQTRNKPQELLRAARHVAGMIRHMKHERSFDARPDLDFGGDPQGMELVSRQQIWLTFHAQSTGHLTLRKLSLRSCNAIS